MKKYDVGPASGPIGKAIREGAPRHTPGPCAHEYDSLSFKEMPAGTIKTQCCKCKSELTALWLTDNEITRAKAAPELLAVVQRFNAQLPKPIPTQICVTMDMLETFARMIQAIAKATGAD